MKHSSYLFLMGLLTICIGPVFSQPIDIGGRLGINASTQFGDTYSGLGLRNGIVIGATARRQLNDLLRLRTGLVYSQEGARNRTYDFSSFSTVIYDQKLVYNYIGIPILLEYQLAEPWFLLGGLQLGIRAAAKESRKIVSGTPSPSDNSAGVRDFSSRIKGLYPFVVAGIGYHISEELEAQARLQLSPFDNVKRKAGDSEGTYPFMIQISLSYFLASITGP